MQNNTRKWQRIFFTLAIVVAGIMYFIFDQSRNSATEQTIAPHIAFGPNNYNLMKTDTFVALVHQAYGGLVIHKTEGKTLLMEIKDNELAKDFFNGNDALLKFSLSDFGFDIKYNPGEKSMKAIFDISDQNGVNIPNDVLIKLMDKTTKINNVDQQ